MEPERWHKVKQIYQTALEMKASERTAFLDQVCADDEALSLEIQSLLEYEEKADQFIESPALEVAARRLAADPAGSLVGRNFGHYKVLSLVGAGGMGEVYRAKDTRLNRTVAIKVLPSHLADRPNQKKRLQREAQAVAALNHPHICVLHDVGQDEGIDYLVMEYLEGETLSARLEKGALSIELVLKYSIQIADALDKAHRRGVVHRDLKPSNVMLTPSGIKLLDFGLAKVGVALPGLRPAAVPTESGRERSSEDPLVAPSRAMKLTGQGTIVGTLHYMAPEQLEGKEADARTDVFALGAVLHEMVTGQKAFQGKSQVSVIAAIMDQTPPPVSSTQPLAPPLLEHVIRGCLAKDPDQRWQSVADILIQLRLISEAGSAWGTRTIERGIKRRELMAWVIIAVLIGVGVILALLVPSQRATTDSSIMRFEVETPQSGFPFHFALSPDGKRLAAVAPGEQGSALWVRRLDDLAPQILPYTDGGRDPFWSPGGRFLGFFAGGKLKKVDFYGAPAETLCEAPEFLGGTWNRDDVILFGSSSGPLFRISASGGPVTVVTQLRKSNGETGHVRPFFLPDGNHFLFVARNTKQENSAVFVGSLGSSQPKLLLLSALKAAFAPPHHLLFVRETTLMAQEFDPNRLELRGDPLPVAENVATNIVLNFPAFSVSQTGLLAYRPGGSRAYRQLVLVDRGGRRAEIAGPPGNFQNPVFSPDGQLIAVSRQDQGRDIWIVNTGGGMVSRFTMDPGVEDHAVWSPDGTRIVFSSDREGGVRNLYEKRSDGAGQEALLLKSDHSKTPLGWSPDGRNIVYEDRAPETGSDLWFLPMLGDKKEPIEFSRTSFNESHAQFSPDGRWLAYVSDVSGRLEVYVQSFPPTGSKWQISTNGGEQPRWRDDGKELFFIGLPGVEQFMAVDVATKPSDRVFRRGEPKKLFQFDVLSVNQRNSYDVTNGQRFLLNVIPRAVATPSVTLIVNWTAGLKTDK